MPGRMVKTLIERRDAHWDRLNDTIEKSLEDVLTAVREFALLGLGEVQSKKIKWIGFSTMTDEAEDDTLVIFAKLNYVEGDTYDDGKGNYVENLTELEASMLASPFQIVIPFKIVENGTKQDILDYFAEKVEYMSEFFRQQAEHEQSIREDIEDALMEEFLQSGHTNDGEIIH